MEPSHDLTGGPLLFSALIVPLGTPSDFGSDVHAIALCSANVATWPPLVSVLSVRNATTSS